jgi:hypothetical protein
MKKKILAIVKDHEEKAYWTPYLHGVKELIATVEIEDVSDKLSDLEKSRKTPSLIIISSGVYPEMNRGLIERLRKRCPESEFLLVVSSSDPLPPLEHLIRDNIRHLVINPENNHDIAVEPESSVVGLAIKKISEGGMLKIGDYLKHGTPIHKIKVSSSDQKEKIIAGLESLICGEEPEMELLRQKGALLADEMLENSLYGAPRGKNGLTLYKKGETRLIRSRERISFRYGFDGENLAIEVEDGWGNLSPKVVLEHLARKEDDIEIFDELGGRGLYIIWRFLDHMHIHINPGRQTVVGGQVRLVTAENLMDAKGFHITTCCAG